MSDHERMFRHDHAHRLDDPERQRWLPVAEVVRRLGVRPGMVIADIGAGTGYFTIPFSRAVMPDGRVFAIDLQPEMLARLRARAEPDAPIVLVEADATRTTIDPASVDLAFLANVWHELDDRPAALREAARIVRAGGRIAILDWRTDVAQPPGPPLAHRIAESDVANALIASGWHIEESGSVGSFSYLVVAGASRSGR